MTATKEYLKKSKSKDTLRNFVWNKDTATVYPEFSFKAVINAIDSDTTAKGAVTHFIDKCMEGDYALIKRDTYKYDKEFELLLDEKYMFRRDILGKSYLSGKLFNNIFIEIVKTTDGLTKSLNVLDSTNIEPITEPNGDVIKFKSKISNPKNGQYAYWDKEEVTWIKIRDRNIGFAPVDIKALYENLALKSYIRDYIGWLWKTGQYRVIYNFENAADQDVLDFMAYTRKHDNNFRAPFFTKGKFQAMMLREMKEQTSLIEMLSYLDNQTLVLLRIPPIDAGIPDASGRSSADAQSNNLNTHIKAFKTMIEDGINFDLFPKINKSNNLIRFAPVDRFEERQIIENVQMMKSMQMTDEAITEYLRDKGMIFGAEKLFNELPQIGNFKNPRDLDNMPSRLGKAEGQGNNKIGTGEQATSRADQVVMK